MFVIFNFFVPGFINGDIYKLGSNQLSIMLAYGIRKCWKSEFNQKLTLESQFKRKLYYQPNQSRSISYWS